MKKLWFWVHSAPTGFVKDADRHVVVMAIATEDEIYGPGIGLDNWHETGIEGTLDGCLATLKKNHPCVNMETILGGCLGYAVE